MRRIQVWLGLFLVASAVGSADAQELGRFQWRRGQVLQYKVEQNTRATDTAAGSKAELSSRVEQIKCWQVAEVEQDGVATLQLSLLRLKLTQKLPTGEVWEFDSITPDTAPKQLREQLAPLIGKPLALLRVAPTGKVIEVKSTAQGSPSRYESEPPFVVSLPGTLVETGSAWARSYRIVLDPPLGAGEKYAAEQTYQVRSAANGQIVVAFATVLKDPPASPLERLPLLQLQPQGEVTIDSKSGLLLNARVTSSGAVQGHQGEGSRYEFTSEYVEQLVSY